MFDSLDEQMKKDDDRISTARERYMKYGLYAAAALLVFGAMLYGVHMM
jgi:hypothetical protein